MSAEGRWIARSSKEALAGAGGDTGEGTSCAVPTSYLVANAPPGRALP